MTLLYVYDPNQRAFVTRRVSPDEQTPFIRRFFFPFSQFCGSTEREICWTDQRALLALDRLAGVFCGNFSIERAFSRPCGRVFSAHAAGAAFDIGGALTPQERGRLRRVCLEEGIFPFVEPPYMSGLSVHVSTLRAPPRFLRREDAGVCVFVLQDALARLGVYRGALNGVVTKETLRAMQRAMPERRQILSDSIGSDAFCRVIAAARD